MRIGIVTTGENKTILSYKGIIEKSLLDKNHTIKHFNTKDNDANVRFTVEKHLIFLVDSGRLFGKDFSSELDSYLKLKGNINVNYCTLFINNRPFCGKVFLKYMSILEKHGFIIQYSDIINNDTEMKDASSSLSFQE